MRLIDSHSHLFLEEFAEDLPQVMARAREAGVTHIFMPNIDSTTIGPMLRVCREYKGYCYPMIGLHPTSVGADYEKELEIVARELASPNEFVAVGEIGMDFRHSLDIIKKFISKKFFILYFVSNLLIFSISHSGKIFYIQIE